MPLKIFRLRECEFPCEFPCITWLDVRRYDWLQCVFWRDTANTILNREVVFENLFDNFVPFLNEMFLSLGSSNQLGECIIKHDDLVPFAQRIVWIKVILCLANDWSWLVELYRVKLKFFKNFSMVFSWVACLIYSLYMFLCFEFRLASIVK